MRFLAYDSQGVQRIKAYYSQKVHNNNPATSATHRCE